MKPPRLLLGAALLFWGWQTGFWLLAIPFALLVELAPFVQAKWEMTEADYARIWRLCTLLFLGTTVIGFFALDGASLVPDLLNSSPARRMEAMSKSSRAVFFLFQWLPVVFFPMIAAQAFGTSEKVPLTAISWLMRRQYEAMGKAVQKPAANISYAYLTICLTGASTAAVGERAAPGFFAGLVLLIGWALWRHRNRRFSAALWGGLLLLAIGAGYTGQKGILQLQGLVERLDSFVISRFARGQFDDKQSKTMLGSIGRLKQSGRIIIRLQANEGAPPELLREASYNEYYGGVWRSAKNDFNTVLAENDQTTWNLLPTKKSTRSILISQYLSGGKGILAVPFGVSQLSNLPVFLLDTNKMGVLKVGAGPGLVSYDARYDQGPSIDTPPDWLDYSVPVSETGTLVQISEALQLREKAAQNPSLALRAIHLYFETNFTYATYTPQNKPTRDGTALSKFLAQTHSGHCEYFATATVLLLRTAGISARYAVGYAVHEHSGKKYVVRQRDGHAWCLVYYNNGWHDFDTTPASWQALESQQASLWQPISDFFSRLWFEFSKWRWGQSGSRKYILWVLIPLLVLTSARLLIQRQWKRRQAKRKSEQELLRPGLDSEFFLIAQRLEAIGLNRQPDETVLGWLKRIEPALPPGIPSLRPLAILHYRLRFDPAGLSIEERAVLRRNSQTWLESLLSAKA